MGTVLFSLGKCVATAGALRALELLNVQPGTLLRRHQSGDWQGMSRSDQAANREAIKHGARVFSAYKLDAIRVYVITEADRSSTTILLPSEY